MPNSQRAGGAGGPEGISGVEFAEVGLQFALTILVFAAAGLWLDKRLGTSPWLLILCVFTGAGGGFAAIYRRVMAAQRRDAAWRADKARARETAAGSADAAGPDNAHRQGTDERGRRGDSD